MSVNCLKRTRELSDIKKHVKEQKDGMYLHHLKLDRGDETKVNFTKYHIDKFIIVQFLFIILGKVPR